MSAPETAVLRLKLVRPITQTQRDELEFTFQIYENTKTVNGWRSAEFGLSEVFFFFSRVYMYIYIWLWVYKVQVWLPKVEAQRLHKPQANFNTEAAVNGLSLR